MFFDPEKRIKKHMTGGTFVNQQLSVESDLQV